MEWIKPGSNLDFMGQAKFWVSCSSFLALVSLVALLVVGLDLGVDFKGGTKVLVEFKKSANIKREDIRDAVAELVRSQTQGQGGQVAVQDFHVGGASASDTVKYEILTELPSLLTPLARLEIAKAVERHFGKGTSVDVSAEAGDRLYVTLPLDWPIGPAKKELRKVLGQVGQRNVVVTSHKEERILMDMYRERDLLLASPDEQVKKEAERVERAAKKKIAALRDRRYTVDVQALKDQVASVLKQRFGKGFVDVLSTASVSPAVGHELFLTGMLALFYAIIGILIYIVIRFDAKFAPGAVLCLVHDTLLVLGLVVLTDVKFTLPIVAALLAFLGYDINDTIVVYDRIRENLKKGTSGNFAHIINVSINETLSRTLLTSFTTELVLLSIILLGGGTIKDFAVVLAVGVILGTYSSIFLASPMTLYLDKVLRRKRYSRA